MTKLIGLICIPIFFLFLPLLTNFQASASFTILSVQPSATRIWGTEQQFEVSITVTDVSDLYGWQFKLYYSSALLNGTSIMEGPFLQDVASTYFFSSIDDNFNVTHGQVTATCTLLGNISGVNGNGEIAKVAFKTKALGATLLAFSQTKLGNPASELISHTVHNGAVEVVAQVYDLAIKNVTLHKSQEAEGRLAGVSVLVANEGNRTENFTINLYANDTLVETQAFTGLTPAAIQSFSMFWNTTGAVTNSTYQIKAEIPYVPEETDLDDNTFTDGFLLIIPRFHDVAVDSITPGYSTVFAGQRVNIVVTVVNNGAYDESFSVTLYYDNSTIGIRSLTNFPIGAKVNLNFIWDTTDVPSNRSYSLKGVASQVPGDIAPLNNTLVNGTILVLPREELSVIVTTIIPCNQIGQPVGSFPEGTVVYLKITVYSNSMNTEPLLLTINIYDAATNAIGVISFKGPAAPGETTFILGSPIPTGVRLGTARVYANTLTDWPHLGGVPYGVEKSTTFQIVAR